MKYPIKLQEIIDDFSLLETNTEKYEELLNYGEELEDMPEEFKIKENLVPGCTSIVYIKTTLKHDIVTIYGSADSYLVKGLVAILIQGLHGLTPQEINDITSDFLTELGLNETLSTTRANASINIFSMIKAQVQKLY